MVLMDFEYFRDWYEHKMRLLSWFCGIMEIIKMGLKPKKFAVKLIRICLTCGSKKISSNEYTIMCTACGALNFYEEVAQ